MPKLADIIAKKANIKFPPLLSIFKYSFSKPNYKQENMRI